MPKETGDPETETTKGIEGGRILDLLGLSKGTVSKMLNYQKGLSKSTIRTLSNHFKLNQEAFNRPYKLKNSINKSFKNASLMNTEKILEKV